MNLELLTGIETDTSVISKLPAQPSLSAGDLQSKFDTAATELKEQINDRLERINDIVKVLNGLVVTTSGDSDEVVMSQNAVKKAIEDKIISLGKGDMQKSVYDTNDDGIVDKAKTAEGLVNDNTPVSYRDIANSIYPVGSIYISASNTNPASIFTWQTWEAFGQGRTLIGVGSVEKNNVTTYGSVTAGEKNFISAIEKGGEYKHTLSAAEMPKHTHTVDDYYMDASQYNKVDFGKDLQVRAGTKHTERTTSSAGTGNSHNNMSPYVTVYMWRRTA